MFPRNDLDDPEKLLSLSGGLWSTYYGGTDVVQTMLAGVGELYQRVHQIHQEAQQTAGRKNFPYGHTEAWYAWELLESSQAADPGAVWRLDVDNKLLDDGLKFDTAYQEGYRISAPLDLLDVVYISDKLGEPTIVLTRGVDFELDSAHKTITFLDNPWNTFESETIFSGGVAADRKLTLWLFRPLFDWQLPYYHLGYLLRLHTPSSPAAVELLNTVLDAISGGTSLQQLDTLVAQMYDMPLALSDGEVVEAVWSDTAYQWILTDQQTYRANLNAVAAVRAGDTLRAGQSLITGLQRLRFNRGQLTSDIPALAIGTGILSPDFQGDLIFENKLVELIVDGYPGSERVSFEIGGHPADVTRFWDTVHTRRLLYGSSLYELLLARDGKLPATVNPAKFLVTHILRNNYLAYRIQLDQIGNDALEMAPRDLLTLLVPPRSSVMLLLELPTFSESVTMDAVEDPPDMLEALDWTGDVESLTSGAASDSYMTLHTTNLVC